MAGRCQRVKEDNQSLLYTFMNLSRKKINKKEYVRYGHEKNPLNQSRSYKVLRTSLVDDNREGLA